MAREKDRPGVGGAARSHPVTLIPGEGIGPEVIAAARRAVEATGVVVDWDVQGAGAEAFEREGAAVPKRTLESVRERGVALKGPLDSGRGRGYRSPSVALRRALDLYATIRPFQTLPGVATPGPAADFVLVKMNHEDLYAGLEFGRGEDGAEALRELLSRSWPTPPADSGFSIKPISVGEARRVIEAACQYATRHGRSKVTVVHKAILMPATDGLFLEIAQDVASQHSDLELDEALVDTVCERLVIRPDAFDVMVMPRMYGDIVSGIAAAMIGGLGVSPGVNIGPSCAVFEAAHGTAPRLAGRGVANPIAMILSAAMMLRHLGEANAGERLERAVVAVAGDRERVTYDLRPGRVEAEALSTAQATDAIIAALEALS